ERIPTQVSPAENPMLTLLDIGWLRLQVEYDQPVPTSVWPGLTTTEDQIVLCSCPQPQPGDLLQHRSFTGANGVSITTFFYWPPRPGGIIIYTAPLARWVETVIEGYTIEPVVLRGWYSQTYRPKHHNFGEHFLFEPQLEPGISQQLLDELRAQDIRLIHLYFLDVNSVSTYGFEDKPFYPADIDGDDDTGLRPTLACLRCAGGDAVCDECGGADLTGDGQVMLDDLREFAENWLARLGAD
ncbi:unnamed protein product, partial [marine sediment metagenome]